MFVKKESWHFRVYNWFNGGDLPFRINLCSYCRTVMFWAPLKAIFFSPWRALFRKSKLAFSMVMFLLFAIIETIAFTANLYAALAINIIILYTLLIAAMIFIPEVMKSRREKKFVQCAEETGRVVGAGLKYGVGLPLKIVFWTIWVKIYDFNRVLFGAVLTLAIGGILGFLAFLGLWEALMVIGMAVGYIAVAAAICWVGLRCKKIHIDLDQNIAWQFLKAKKQKICPFIVLIELV